MANSVDPDQTAPIGAVCSGSMLFAFILNSSKMLGNYLQQMTSADIIFRCIFFLGPLRVNTTKFALKTLLIHLNIPFLTLDFSKQNGISCILSKVICRNNVRAILGLLHLRNLVNVTETMLFTSNFQIDFFNKKKLSRAAALYC